MFPILIIEDDECFLKLLETIFVAEGYQVHVALDGKHGCALADAYEPSGSSSIWMPKREGLESIRIIRRLLPESRIIAMSGQPMLADVSLFKLAREAGADATILKPFLPIETRPFRQSMRGETSAATNGNHL